jgi:hypothetical protein
MQVFDVAFVEKQDFRHIVVKNELIFFIIFRLFS